jgi:hypothetical protein
MTPRPLPRSWRGRALPRSGDTTVTWPPALRGRSPLLYVLLLGWLGGGVLATVVAATDSPNDLAYGLTNTAAALVGLLLLAVAGVPDAVRRCRRTPEAAVDGQLDDALPVPVPAQPEPAHDDRRAPALR